ncbi:zinc finger protein 62-like [Uranotaenia lowii]|uniref:zinc finger protein 62-like n=1 Tax=Uranotaenia lowii TaxID=190385 RepID=UPI00247A04F6|nr:zinc finger protein 62-like [Uranotaenia lowii]
MDLNYILCRLCLVQSEEGEMIVLNHHTKFIESILQITSVNVTPIDDRLIHMCSTCLETLEKCIEFRSNCIQNDNYFYKLCSGDVFKSSDFDKKSVQLSSKKPEIKQEKSYNDSHCGLISEENFPEENLKIATQQKSPEFRSSSFQEESVFNNADFIDHDSSESMPEKPKKRKTLKVITSTKNPKKRGRKPKMQNELEQSSSDSKRAKQESKKMQCDVCGLFLVQANLTDHRQTHDPSLWTHECSFCSKIFSNAKRLKYHINSKHTREKKYQCDKCDKFYYNAGSLWQHTNAEHSGGKKYQCSVCGEKFAHSSGRDRHFINHHSFARPHGCTYCDKTFKIRSELTLHIRTHTGEKPFKCDICGKAFAKSYNVVIHKKSHQNELQRSATASVSNQGKVSQI